MSQPLNSPSSASFIVPKFLEILRDLSPHIPGELLRLESTILFPVSALRPAYEADIFQREICFSCLESVVNFIGKPDEQHRFSVLFHIRVFSIFIALCPWILPQYVVSAVLPSVTTNKFYLIFLFIEEEFKRLHI